MSSVLIKKENFYYEVVLNRPEKHNAFDPELIEKLTQFFILAEKDQHAGAVVLSGKGPSFCAGGDLQWMKSMANYTFEDNCADAKKLLSLFEAAGKCSLPVIGVLHGNVFGGGVGLASICDIAIAETDTQFSFSEVKLGIVPAVISSFVLNKMHKNKAVELMLTGQIFNTETALNSGLIEYYGRELESREYLKKTLEAIRTSGPQAVRETKKLVQFVTQNSLTSAQEKSVQVIAERRVSDEGQEGLKSFFEKRKPNWIWKKNEPED